MLGVGRKHPELVQINSEAIHGEPGTGFEKRKEGGKSGPFECMNCEYFEHRGACKQKDMKEKSKQPKNGDGTVKVAGKDCCSFIERLE